MPYKCPEPSCGLLFSKLKPAQTHISDMKHGTPNIEGSKIKFKGNHQQWIMAVRKQLKLDQQSHISKQTNKTDGSSGKTQTQKTQGPEKRSRPEHQSENAIPNGQNKKAKQQTAKPKMEKGMPDKKRASAQVVQKNYTYQLANTEKVNREVQAVEKKDAIQLTNVENVYLQLQKVKGNNVGQMVKTENVYQQAFLEEEKEIPQTTAEQYGEAIDPNNIHMMGNTRVFIGSLPPNTSEEKVRTLLAPYGELMNCYVNPLRNFAMVRFATRQQAYRAQVCLHCTTVENNFLIVRLAPHPAALWIGELGAVVSNEILYSAFSRFGDIEKAVVVRDQRGHSLGYGFVEFIRKASATTALQHCNANGFLLTRSPHPVRVEAFRFREEDVGLVADDVTNDVHYFPLLTEQDELSKAPRFVNEPLACDETMRNITNKWLKMYQEEKHAKQKWKAEFTKKRRQLNEEMKIAMREEDKRINEMRHQQDKLEKELAEIQGKIHNHQQAQTQYTTSHESSYYQPQQHHHQHQHQYQQQQQHQLQHHHHQQQQQQQQQLQQHQTSYQYRQYQGNRHQQNQYEKYAQCYNHTSASQQPLKGTQSQQQQTQQPQTY